MRGGAKRVDSLERARDERAIQGGREQANAGAT
jgi:hypothetical protein